MSRVEIRIDELLLDGVDPGDRAGLSRSVARELARLVSEHGTPIPARAESVDAGAIEVSAGVGGELARSVAGAVHRGLSR